MSYTTFAYGSLEIHDVDQGLEPYPTGHVMQGGHIDLWEVVGAVTVEIQNNGTMDGAKAAQLYLAIPGALEKQLRGVEKPSIQCGETVKVTFEMTRRDLSVWDAAAQNWKLQYGEYDVYVGSSSREISLHGVLEMGGNTTSKRI